MNNKDSAVALITGASSGIGLVTAKALQRGKRVAVPSMKKYSSTASCEFLIRSRYGRNPEMASTYRSVAE